MRDNTHKEQVERWARFVRDNPRRVWKGEQARFIDSQIIMANRFYSRLEKTPGGKEKIQELRNMKNISEISEIIDNNVARKLGLKK